MKIEIESIPGLDHMVYYDSGRARLINVSKGAARRKWWFLKFRLALTEESISGAARKTLRQKRNHGAS